MTLRAGRWFAKERLSVLYGLCTVAASTMGAVAHGAAPGASPAPTHAQHAGAQSAVRSPLRFDATTWATLLAQGPRPAAYVFSTTHCPTCPMAFDALHEAVRASGQRVELAAVVMDAQGSGALVHLRHYTGVTRAYAFDGFEPEIRYSVDPKWRNVTPYVVLVDRKGQLQRFTGQPQAEHLKNWLP